MQTPREGRSLPEPPAPRWARWTGLGVAATTVALYVILLVGSANVTPDDPVSDTWVSGALWMLSWVPFGLVGGLLIARRPRLPVGWLLAGIALPLVVVLLLDGVTAMAVERSDPGHWLPWAAWLASWMFAPTVPLIGLLLASLPSGRIVTPLLARLAPVQIGTVVGIAALRAIRPGPTDTAGVLSPIALPIDRDVVETAIRIVTVVAVVYGFVAAGDLLVRWARSRGVERRQATWVAAAVGAVLVAAIVLTAVEPWLDQQLGPTRAELIGSLVFAVGLGGVPTAIGIAVLRYRLYEIDRLVSRVVTYSLVTALLAGLYAVLVIGVQRLIGGDRVPDIVVAGSTLVVAGVARPAVHRIRAVVDRRFNRATYDATRVVAAFGARVRDEVELDDVVDGLATTARTALAPASISVWLTDPTRPT